MILFLRSWNDDDQNLTFSVWFDSDKNPSIYYDSRQTNPNKPLGAEGFLPPTDGLNAGDIIRQNCDGTTGLTFTAQDQRPYADVYYTENSELCPVIVGPVDSPAPIVYGCMNKAAINYLEGATVDDGSCQFEHVIKEGCTNKRANNYDETATVDDGTCQFGPPEGAKFRYEDKKCLTLVFNEPESKWATEQTHRAQNHFAVDGKHIHSLPLPGQSADAPNEVFLWEHNSGPELIVRPGSSTPPGVLLYGRRHKTWFEVIVLGAGAHTIKNLDNLVLVSNDELPTKLIVTAPEQGTFEQTLIGERNHLTTVERVEQLTYVQLVAPEPAPWGGRVRAQYVRVRIEFAGRRQLRLSKLFALLRESVA